MIPLPEDLESERLLLSTLCAPGADHAAAVLVPTICAEDFHHPHHRAIFLALEQIVRDRDEVSLALLADTMKRQGSIDRVGGFPGLSDALSHGEVARPDVLGRLLASKRKQRALMGLGMRIYQEASKGDPSEVIASASSDLCHLAQESGKGGAVALNSISDEALADILDRMEGRSQVGTKMHSWPRLNGLTHGFQPQNLIILAARPGIGKTALALNWILRSAMLGRRGMVFSMEMSKEEIWSRMASDKAGVNTRDMIANKDYEAFKRFGEAKQDLDALPIHVCDRGKITVSEIAAEVEHTITRHGSLGMVVIDYLQLITSPGVKGQTETVRIGEISRGLKLLAKDVKVPIILLSQLNREVEKRSGGKPQLSDLRDSGCIEQDADMVMFIHRQMDQTATDLIVAKHRNGPCMTIPLSYKADLTRYIELEREAQTFTAPTHDYLEDLV